MTDDGRLEEVRSAPKEKLSLWIQQGDEQVLHAVLDNPNCEPFHAILILNNAYVTEAVVQRVLDHPDWMSHYKVKVALVNCRATPFSVASRLVYELFWRDLAMLALNFRVDPRLRRTAERLVLQKLEEMSVGERMALAKIASRNLLVHLRNVEREPGVLRNILRNPRLVEEDLLALLSRPRLPVEFIRELVQHPEWAYRENVRMAIFRHPHTPTHVALQLARRMKANQVRRLLQDPSVRPTIKRALKRHFRL